MQPRHRRFAGPMLALLGTLLLTASTAAAADKPDLVVSTLSDPPATARAGDSFALVSSVTNQGLAPAGTSSTKFYLVVGTSKKNLKGVQPIGELDPGQTDGATITISVYSDTNPGVYTLQACADGDGDVSEALENNNCRTAAAGITIVESPDLVVTSITNPPSSAGQGAAITVKSVVKNVGAINADPTVTKYYLVNTTTGLKDDLKGSQNVPLLKPGQTFTGQDAMTIRPETEPGLYKLQACADSGKTSPEVDEQNNCLTSTGSIQVTAQPDLVVTQVTVAPALPTTVLPGASLAITATVENRGLVQAKSSTMKFVLIGAGGAEKNLNGTASTPIVAAGATVVVQKTVTVYSDTAPGPYSVQACADSTKGVPELLESNNCEIADGALTVQGPATGHSDLVVTGVTDPPADMLPSSTFTVAATVLNQGVDPAAASTTSFWLVNVANGARKSVKGGQSVGALAPGASASPAATLSLYSDTVPATYTLQACADGPKALAEENEANNCANAAQTITVLKVPNLLVSSITNPPATVTLGGSFKLTNSVRNVGSVSAGTTNTKYYLVLVADGTRKDLQGTQVVPILNAGQTFSEQETLTVREDTVPGQYKVQACADGGKDVAESNEDDNCTTTAAVMKIVRPPDLIVTNVVVKNAPLSVNRGGTLTITGTVKNQGEGDTVPSTMKYLLVNSTTGATKNLNGTMDYGVIRSGASLSLQRIVTVYADTPVGVYVVQACADSLDVVVETSETNNCFTTTATITVQ